MADRAGIVLVAPDATWPAQFTAEAERLRGAFADTLIALRHIGSTAIPGLVAKPVIDMLAVVHDVRALDARTDCFTALGYEAMGEFGLPGRRYFRRDRQPGVRTHHLHAYAPASSEEIARHLGFRDYLRAHPDEAAAYAALKQTLAATCGGDTGRYTDGKTAFVRRIEALAREGERTPHSISGP